MIINSITLKNFRSYEETTFSFTPQENKNVVLIGGENGAGKSTLFEAIKLCIYGPITYGYLGSNYNYQSKIKSNINDNAFKNEDIESFVALSISFKEGTEIKNYNLKRIWKYKNHKLKEEFKVFLNDEELSEEDKLYFDKYLKSVLPPSLFDFFFFDGEELSDFFVGKSSNLKEAVLELFNYDTFDVLKKQLLSYQRTHSKGNKNLDEAQAKFEELSSDAEELKNSITSLEDIISNNETILEDLIIKRKKLEEDFRHSGGVFEEERVLISSEINNLESERTEINQKIKEFCNNTLPFLIVSKLLKKTKKQIEEEENLVSFNSISQKLSSKVLESTLEKYVSKDNMLNYEEIALTLLEEMFEVDKIKNISNILELSKEDKNSVNILIDNILYKNDSLKNNILWDFNRLKDISSNLKSLREKLNSTVSGELLNNYLESSDLINREISEAENIIVSSKAKLEEKNSKLSLVEYHLVRAKNELTSLLQNNNILEMSSNIILYLDKLLKNITRDKINSIEVEFIKIFKNIIRKDNYVNSIVIDDSFNATLYINKEYDTKEILNILTNLGFEGTEKKYGAKFIEDLFNHFKINTYVDLTKKLKEISSIEYISLSSKVNINDFSKGEKQIYILCLIWAIIKSSGVEIPFIIDTPYARIDETHRNALTTTYLPNISKQVIILSTNKEIDSDLYKVIKPYVCNEYILLYNTDLRKTEVKKGYFEV